MGRGPNNAMGQSTAQGPGGCEWIRRREGVDIRPLATIYDFAGRDPM